MKTKNLLSATLLLIFGVVACENVIETPVNPGDETKTYTIKLRAGGEIDVAYQPLTRFTPDDRDLYGVQVWHKPATAASYEYYAYGLFESLENVELEVTENYHYKFAVVFVDDGKDKVYCDSVLVDKNYYLGYDRPFRGVNKYNGASTESITQLTNQFVYASDRHFLSSSTSTYNQSFVTRDGKVRETPEGVDFYYGEVDDYTPTEDGATLSIYLKRMVFGVKVIIDDFLDNGKIALSMLGYDYIFTPENKVLEKTYSWMQGPYYSWYEQADLSRTNRPLALDFKWNKDDGSVVEWYRFNADYYRLKQTVFTLKYYGEDEVLGSNIFDIHYEDTPIEEGYKNYTYGSEQDDYKW